MSLYATPEARAAIARTIFISGSTRTGSTMMGQLFHSLDGMEYAFEPPFLYHLVPLIGRLPGDAWRFLFEAYLYEDLTVGAVTGRYLNLNRHDDSSVWKAKPAAEVEARLDTAFRRPDIVAAAEARHLAFKSVDLLPYLRPFRALYPEMPVIVMGRRPESVLVSVLRKGWNADADLYGAPRVFPLKTAEPPYIPYWVRGGDEDRYVAMSELERCCLYYVTMYADVAAADLDLLVIDYDRFVERPRATFEDLVGRLGLAFGSRTDDLLAAVAEPIRDRSVDLGAVDPALRRRMLDVAEACRARSLA